MKTLVKYNFFLFVILFFSSCISSSNKSNNEETIAKLNSEIESFVETKRQYKTSSEFDHIEHIRKISQTRKIDGKDLKPNCFIDYIIENRLENPSHKRYITDRNFLKPIKVKSCTEDKITFRDTLSNGKICEIELIATEFNEENHIVKIRSSEDNTFKDYESIDGKFPYGGLYGAIKMELQSIKITINNRSIIIANDFLPSINHPKFCSRSLLKGGFEAYQDVDDIYIYVSGGNAANAYFGKLIFNQSSYVTSIMVDYWPLSMYGSFGPHFIGF